MTDQNLGFEEEIETYISLDVDFDLLMEVLDSDIANSSLRLNDTPAEQLFGPLQPQTEYYMPLGAAPFSLQLPVMPAHGLNAANTNPPLPPPYYAPAEEKFGPQQLQIEYYKPLGAAPFSLQQPVMPPHGFHAANTNPPLPPPYYAPAEELFGPLQPQTEYYMPLGAAPFSLQQPVMPAPGWPLPMYQPPTDLQPNYMYPQAAPFSYTQVTNVPVTNPVPVGLINGEFVYELPVYTGPPVASDAIKVEAYAPQKRELDIKPGDESRLYIRNPPNAFMIFCMEQRPRVVAELQNSDWATVNRVIGQKGIRKKRIRRKGPSTAEGSVI